MKDSKSNLADYSVVASTNSKSKGKNATVSSSFSSIVARTWEWDVSMYLADPHEAGSFLSCPKLRTRSWLPVISMV